MRLRGLANGFGPWCDIWSRSGWRVQRHADDGRARVVPPAGAPPIPGDEDQCIAMAARLAPPSRRKRAAVLLHGILTRQGAAAIPLPQCTRVAIIAGGNGARGFNPLLNGDNDATVTVAETQMPEINAAFLLVRATHNALAADRATAAATLSFLQTGRVGA